MAGMLAQQFALATPSRLVIVSSTSRAPPEAGIIWEGRIPVARAQGMAAHVEPTLARWFTAPYREAHPKVMDRIGTLIAQHRWRGSPAGMRRSTVST